MGTRFGTNHKTGSKQYPPPQAGRPTDFRASERVSVRVRVYQNASLSQQHTSSCHHRAGLHLHPKLLSSIGRQAGEARHGVLQQQRSASPSTCQRNVLVMSHDSDTWPDNSATPKPNFSVTQWPTVLRPLLTCKLDERVWHLDNCGLLTRRSSDP